MGFWCIIAFVSVKWQSYELDQPFGSTITNRIIHKRPTICTQTYMFLFYFIFGSAFARRRPWQIFLTPSCWAMPGNSRKASLSPFVCRLISVSFPRSGHKSATFAFRQPLESLLGIWLETAESNRERGRKEGIRINELQRLQRASWGKTGKRERHSQTQRACRIEGG